MTRIHWTTEELNQVIESGLNLKNMNSAARWEEAQKCLPENRRRPMSGFFIASMNKKLRKFQQEKGRLDIPPQQSIENETSGEFNGQLLGFGQGNRVIAFSGGFTVEEIQQVLRASKIVFNVAFDMQKVIQSPKPL